MVTKILELLVLSIRVEKRGDIPGEEGPIS